MYILELLLFWHINWIHKPAMHLDGFYIRVIDELMYTGCSLRIKQNTWIW